MDDLKSLNNIIFKASKLIRSKEVEELLEKYQSLPTEMKKEFINLFFDEKVYDTSVVDKSGTLVVIITSKELAR